MASRERCSRKGLLFGLVSARNSGALAWFARLSSVNPFSRLWDRGRTAWNFSNDFRLSASGHLTSMNRAAGRAPAIGKDVEVEAVRNLVVAAGSGTKIDIDGQKNEAGNFFRPWSVSLDGGEVSGDGIDLRKGEASYRFLCPESDGNDGLIAVKIEWGCPKAILLPLRHEEEPARCKGFACILTVRRTTLEFGAVGH